MTSQISIGFTGTRKGMTDSQKKSFTAFMRAFTERFKCVEFHHGDCVGADDDAHMIARTFPNVIIVIHPPTNSSQRAMCKGDKCHNPFPYLQRNKNIVDASKIVVACPGEIEEQQRSGTWSTIRYARKRAKGTTIIYPE